MALDQTPTTSAPDSPTVSAIENEFASYRAISSAAVLSMILALASVFCYASLWFLVIAATAVVIGLVSLRNIRRLPEILTGAVFARIGIGLALLFGLTSVTRAVAQEFLVSYDAGRFARLYVDIIKDKPIGEAMWYQQPPAYRQTKSPDEIVEELKKAKGTSSMSDAFKEKSATLSQIKERLKGQGEEIRFARIETKVVDGLTTYANALVELDGPGSKDFPEKEQFALVEMVKGPHAGPYDWVVESIRFPYTPASAVATAKAADDGHGHGH